MQTLANDYWGFATFVLFRLFSVAGMPISNCSDIQMKILEVTRGQGMHYDAALTMAVPEACWKQLFHFMSCERSQAAAYSN